MSNPLPDWEQEAANGRVAGLGLTKKTAIALARRMFAAGMRYAVGYAFLFDEDTPAEIADKIERGEL